MNILAEVKERGSTVPREFVAGFSTFATMVYILIVQPLIMGECGMPADAVFTMTALCTALATICMGLFARLPFALSTAMGTNAIFAYSIVIPGLATWQEALGMIFVSGIIFMLISFTPVRAKIVDNIPSGLKDGLAPAIGVFLMMLGLGASGMNLAGVIEGSFKFADLKNPQALIGFACLLFTLFIYFWQRKDKDGKIKRVPGAVLIGIIVTTVVLMVGGFAPLPESVISLPPNPMAIVGQLDITGALRPSNWIFIFIFFLGDFFSTAGTVIACGRKAGLYDLRTNTMPGLAAAFRNDAVWTTAGAVGGLSTITTFVESAAGVESGGRTGLTALSTAFWFLVALLLSPIFLSIPAAASGVALTVVGFSMFLQVFDIDKVLKGEKAAEVNLDGLQSKYSQLDKVPIIAVIVITPIVNDFAISLCFGLIVYGVFQIAAWSIDKRLGVETPKIAVPSVMTFVLLALAVLKFAVTI